MESKSRGDPNLAGLVAMAAGIFIAIFVHLFPQPGDAPELIGDACAGIFFFAGLAIFAEPRGWTLVSKLAGLLAAYMLIVPGAWVAFAGNSGRCSVGIAIGGIGLGGSGPDLLCRSVFGIGALVVLVVAALFTWQAFRPRRED